MKLFSQLELTSDLPFRVNKCKGQSSHLQKCPISPLILHLQVFFLLIFTNKMYMPNKFLQFDLISGLSFKIN